MANLDKRQLERLRYFPGQDLRACDFREQAAVEAQLRWWHNRAEHGAYGVRFGLQAAPAPVPGGGAPATVVVVQPGLAYDAFGRELVLGIEAQVAVPALPEIPGGVAAPSGAAPRVLTLRYAELAPAAAVPATEPCEGQAQTASTAELAWRAGDRLRPADGVPLARMTVQEGHLAWDVAFRQPLASPVVQPRFATGATLAGGTAWTSQTRAVDEGNLIQLGFRVWIDTRAAGFTRMPCYFAWRQGALDGGSPSSTLLLEHVGRVFLTGFYFHVLTASPSSPQSDVPAQVRAQAAALQLARQNLSVGWLAILPPPAAVRPIPLPFEVNHGQS
jgi:hypothetical protein